MRLHPERLVDWKALLELRRGEVRDRDGAPDAIRPVLGAAAARAAGVERPAREHRHAEATLALDDDAEPPVHMRAACAKLRDGGVDQAAAAS